MKKKFILSNILLGVLFISLFRQCYQDMIAKDFYHLAICLLLSLSILMIFVKRKVGIILFTLILSMGIITSVGRLIANKTDGTYHLLAFLVYGITTTIALFKPRSYK